MEEKKTWIKQEYVEKTKELAGKTKNWISENRVLCAVLGGAFLGSTLEWKMNRIFFKDLMKGAAEGTGITVDDGNVVKN